MWTWGFRLLGAIFGGECMCIVPYGKGTRLQSTSLKGQEVGTTQTKHILSY